MHGPQAAGASGPEGCWGRVLLGGVLGPEHPRRTWERFGSVRQTLWGVCRPAHSSTITETTWGPGPQRKKQWGPE